MQPESQIFAEDSCLKYQFDSQHVGVDGEVHDVEKAEVKDDDVSVADKTVIETDGKENGGAGLKSVAPESDGSSVTAIDGIDEKDDFPEGGLKG